MSQTALRLHRWIGLGLLLLWMVQGLTGALIVFHREAQILHYDFSPADARPIISPAKAIAAAEAATGEKVVRLNIHNEDARAWQAYMTPRGERTVFIDARTGAVKGIRLRQPPPGGEGTWAFLYDLHEGLKIERYGEHLLAVSGLFLAVSVVLGLKLAWPRRHQWKAAVLPPLRGGTRARLYQLHRAAGLVLALFLALTALCGASINYASQIRAWTGAQQAPRGLASTPPAAGAAMIGIDAAVALAQARYPEAALAGVDPATQPLGTIRVRLTQPQEYRAFFGATQVVLDAYSGAVLYDYDAVRAPLVNRMLDATYSIHTGEIFGLAGRLFVLVLGVALVGFCLTGSWMWLLRRRAA